MLGLGVNAEDTTLPGIRDRGPIWTRNLSLSFGNGYRCLPCSIFSPDHRGQQCHRGVTFRFIGDEAIGFFGAMVGGGILLLSLLVALRYRSKFGARPWHACLPFAFVSPNAPDEWDARVFQAISILLLAVVPLVLLWICVGNAAKGTQCELDTDRWKSGGFFSLAMPLKPQGMFITIKKSDYENERDRLRRSNEADSMYAKAIDEEIRNLEDAKLDSKAVSPGQIRLVGDQAGKKFCIGKAVGGIEIFWWEAPLVAYVIPGMATALALVWFISLFLPIRLSRS